MSTWKKVHVEDANTTHGTITATLADNTSSMTAAGSVHVVTVANDGQSEQALTTRTITLASGAFTSVSGTNTGDEPDASTSQKGVVELATNNEANTGTDTARAVTPANLGAFTGTANIVTVGTIATGVWEGTDIAVAHGGTGASSASDARTNLGLVIGTDVLAHDANLASFLTALNLPTADGSANQVLATNGSGTLSFADAAVNTDVNVSDANLRTRLAALDNSAVINIGDADDDCTVVIRGNLQVDGTTTTVNSTTLTVDDINIVVASGAASASAANGAGITVDVDADSNYSVNPQFQWHSTHAAFSEWQMVKGGGESTAFVAAMMEEASFSDLNATTPGIGTLGIVGGELYVQTA